jgi:hypothetical protein
VSAHDRRGFFGELLRSVARVGAEVDQALGSLRGEDPETGTEPPDDADELEVVDAAPATATATAADVRSICDELGRPEWAEEAAAAASMSVRLTHGGGSSRLGGPAPLPPGTDRPQHEGRPLPLVLCLDLSEVGPLPFGGRSLLFFASPGEPESARVVLGTTDAPLVPQETDLPEVPLAASRELVLPALPPSLELDPTDLEAWARVRAHLARRQGVELEEQSADYHALHRLLGEPDLVAHVMDEEAARDEEGTSPADWQLLLQVSSDPAAALHLPPYERLYTWIPRRDLAVGRFDRCRTFLA